MVFALVLNQVLPADAAKGKTAAKKKGVSEEVITDMTTKIDNLTKKSMKGNYTLPKIQNN